MKKQSEYESEYKNAMNYLRELVDEFKNGMKKIYQDEIEFKDLDE